jgi:hypothetical protein
VFDALKIEALAAFDRIIRLDLNDVVVDGFLHKAPYGGEGTGPNPTDRAKLGWKWAVASERHGIPLGWATDGAHRKVWSLMQLERHLRPDAYGRVRGGYIARRRPQATRPLPR